MKKLFFCFFCLFMYTSLIFAGGIVTNTNQSVGWTRMLARDASTSTDATYYNPAGLTKLSDGFHLYLSNQTILQDRTLSNSLFPSKKWEGNVDAPIYPNLYVAYKTGKFAFSAGFLPIGGGGSADFTKGIPMIERIVASLPSRYTAAAAALGTTLTGAYSYNSNFKGTSVYYGIQGGVSYAINDMISAYVGARYVIVKNSIKGSITDISLPTAQTGVAINYALLSSIPALAPYATGVADKHIDVEQTGTGIAPILGLNLSFLEDKLNFGIRYEFQNKIDVENETKTDDTGLYPDGDKTNCDVPAVITLGIGYKFSDKLSAQIGFHTYFDENTGWAVVEGSNPEINKIDKNFFEFDAGIEYSINEKLLLSCGYLLGVTGVNDYFYSDMTMSLNSSTVGVGGVYKINDMISCELGFFNGWYSKQTITDPSTGLYSQTYEKSNFGFSIGLDFNFGGGK